MADNFKSDLEMDRQELMDEGFDPDYNDRDDSLTGDPTSGTDLAKALGKAGFAGLALIARQLGFDFYPTKDTERAIEKRFGFNEGGDTYGMAAQMDDLVFRSPNVEIDPDELRQASIDTEREVMREINDPEFEGFKYQNLDLAAPPMSTTKKSPYSRRPGFRGKGPFDFKGFGSYLKEQVSKEELTAGLDNAGEWMVPFYEAGSNMANVISEYNKPEDERDYDYIKEELGKAGNSAATEAAMWLMGGIAIKYGGKGIKAIADKVKQYEIDPNTTSAFGVGAIRKKDTFEEVMTPVKVTSKGTQKTGEAILRPSTDLAEDLDPRMGRAMAAETAGSIMPGPGKFFDPSKKGYKGDRFTGMLKDADIELDLEFGNYIMMGKGAPKDVSNETFENLFVSARPSQKRTTFGQNNKSVARANLYDGPSLTVSDMKANYKAATGKTGPEVRTNLLQPERFKIVTDEGDRLLDHPIVAVETKGKGGKHFYTLDTQFVGPVRMDRLTQKAKRKNPRTGEVREEVPQPNLRPATVGDVKVGEQVGTIRVGKKEHPLYDYIEVDATMSAPEGMGSIPKFNEGGMAMKEQMGYALGGDVEIDAESGNAVPPGSRPEEVRDDIPAMLSEGEYVVPADVVRYYGVRFFENLRGKAKEDFAMMEANGRIGGEPVPQDDDDLTSDEMALLDEVMGMNQGGMVPQMNQQQMMNPIPSVAPQMQQPQQPVSYNQPANMNQGGMIGQRPNTDAFGNPIGPGTNRTPSTMPTYLQDINQGASNVYGLDKGRGDDPTSSIQVQGPVSTMPPPPTGESGMKSVYYIHKDGRRIYVLILNGRPISPTPADFDQFLEDTPENRAKLGGPWTGSEGGEGGTGGGTEGPATTGATEDSGGDTSTDVYKTSATGGGVTKDTNTPEGAFEAYQDSGVDVNGTVEAAKKALDDTTKIPKVAGMVAGAVNPFLGLAVGAGNVANQLTGVSKAHANKRMAEFLGKTEDANAIQADIDRFLQNAPGAVNALDDIVATGEQRFQDALSAATSVNAPDEAVIYTDDLNEVGKANLQEYLQTFKTDATTSRDVSIRPMLRPEGLGAKTEVAAEPKVAARPKGKYDPTSNPQLSGGFKTNTLSAAEQVSFDAAVDSGNGAVANHFASINRLRNKQDAYAESGFDPAVGSAMGLSAHDMEQAEKYGGSVQTAINEGRAEKESGILNFLKPVKVTDDSKSKKTTTTASSTRKTSTDRVASTSTGGTKTSTIKSGDTLTKIARENNTTVDALVAANPQIKNKNVIKAGDKISIPKTTSSGGGGGSSSTKTKTSSGGGSSSTKTTTTTRSTADIQKDINKALKDSGGTWTNELNDLVAEREKSKKTTTTKTTTTKTKSSGGGGGGGSSSSSTKSSGGGGCFLTTAIVDRRGEADNGPTLTKLRNFRDTYMAAIPADVEEYYRVAPQIVASIPEDHKDWDWIGSQVDKSVEFIDNNLLDDAYKTYKAMVKKLERDWL